MKNFPLFLFFVSQPWFVIAGVLGVFGDKVKELAEFIVGAYVALILIACFIFGIHMVMSESANLMPMIYSWIGL